MTDLELKLATARFIARATSTAAVMNDSRQRGHGAHADALELALHVELATGLEQGGSVGGNYTRSRKTGTVSMWWKWGYLDLELSK